MKTHVFKPFRLVNGKVVVISYLAWRKVAIETKKGIRIEIDCNIHLVPEMQVVDYKGNPLYWFTDEAFIKIPIVYYPWSVSHRLYDCDGVPAFSHVNDKYIKDEPMNYRPLMTSDIIREFHIMADRLHVKYTRELAKQH